MRRIINFFGRVLIIGILIWLIVANFVPEVLPFGRTPAWTTVTHPQYGFSIGYSPKNWTADIYGENGYKNQDDVKLILRRRPSGRAVAEIIVRYKPATKPTLADVVAWKDTQIANWNRYLRTHNEEIYKELAAWEEVIDGKTVMRKRYGREEIIIVEDVYIARTSDMIIISLQSPEYNFDKYLQEFDAIVTSFRPLN